MVFKIFQTFCGDFITSPLSSFMFPKRFYPFSLQMRLAHLLTDDAVGCMDSHRPFEDAIKEFADWLDIPENNDELLRIYINVSSKKYHHKT